MTSVTRAVSFLALFMMIATDRALGGEDMAFRYDQATERVVFINHRGLSIHDRTMRYVIDWSRDYSRGPGFGEVLQNDFLVFVGHLNHSRSILYVYNMPKNSLTVVENAEMISLSDKFGWALIQAPPLYSAANGEVERRVLLVNGVEVGLLDPSAIVSIKWSDSGLELKLAPKIVGVGGSIRQDR